MRIKSLNYEGHRHCEEDASPTWQSTFNPLILNIKDGLLRLADARTRNDDAERLHAIIHHLDVFFLK